MRSTKSILIVDDEPNVRLVLRTTLESTGYQVLEAGDGATALELASSPGCDLVLLDLLMPRMDGMETLRRLRALGNATPVVILTAHGSIPDAVMAMKLGAIDFLTKPITPQALRLAVADVIQRQDVETATPKSTKGREQDRSKQILFDLARAKRALNRGEFTEAERLLTEIIALDPGSEQAHELLDRLAILKEQEASGGFRILRDWFPGGALRGKP
jgi:DNA-binding response OmpR family regulator